MGFSKSEYSLLVDVCNRYGSIIESCAKKALPVVDATVGRVDRWISSKSQSIPIAENCGSP